MAAQERDQERGEDSRKVTPPKPGEGAGLGESCSGCLSGGGSSGYLLLPNELPHTTSSSSDTCLLGSWTCSLDRAQ